MKVTLLKEHTHAGKKYPAGSQIEVSDQEAEFLRAHKIIDAAETAAKKKGE